MLTGGLKPSFLIASGIWVLLFPWVEATPAQAQIVIVVNAQSPIDSVSHAELKKIFKGEYSLRNSVAPVQVVEYTPLCEAFYKRLYGESGIALSKHWLRLMFKGKRVLPPKSFADISRFCAFLKSHANAVGFLPAEVFSAVNEGRLKAVVVDGKRFDHTAYVLAASLSSQ